VRPRNDDVVWTVSTNRHAEVPKAQHRFTTKLSKDRASRFRYGSISGICKCASVVHSSLSQFRCRWWVEVETLSYPLVKMTTAN
jgi:hypothetical protein